MPSPFPGMDPYLDNAIYWPGFHHNLITFLATTLNAILPPQFAANVEVRVYLERPNYLAIPKGTPILRTYKTLPKAKTSSAASTVLDAPERHGVVEEFPLEVKEGYVVIRSANRWEDVITVIEVLSPSNKTAGSTG